MHITGKRPRFLWLPEGGTDTQTSEVMADFEIEGLIGGPEQVELRNGGPADNVPTRVVLPSGRSVVALPFDGYLSRRLAFDDENKYRANADCFTDKVILPAFARLNNGFPLLAYTDGETFGHHMRWGGAFLDWLLNHSLPERGITPKSINEIDLKPAHLTDGRIKERSAWSCEHGDLGRWWGRCGCCEGTGYWKQPFYSALHGLNDGVSQLAQREFGSNYIEKIINNFDQGLKNPGPSTTTPELSLISAKLSALVALTSCGFYFKDPHVSGRINVLFARQTVEHLSDAGSSKAAVRLWNGFLDTMKKIPDPINPSKTLLDMSKDLLGETLYLAA